MRNPYSATHSVSIDIKHYVGCGATPTDLNGDPPTLGITTFKTVNSLFTNDVPTAEIKPAAGATGNFVASKNGNFEFKFKGNANVNGVNTNVFPKYGGVLKINIPKWYPGAT